MKHKLGLILVLIIGVAGMIIPHTLPVQAQNLEFEFVGDSSSPINDYPYGIRDSDGNIYYIYQDVDSGINQDLGVSNQFYFQGPSRSSCERVIYGIDADSVPDSSPSGTLYVGECDSGNGSDDFASLSGGERTTITIAAEGTENNVGESAEEETCESRSHADGFSFGWFACGAIDWFGGMVVGLFNWILGGEEEGAEYCNLVVNLDDSNTSSSCSSFDTSNVREAWGAFRTLANVFFVIAFLYAIYQVAFAAGNNAYLIRSMLPKLAAAAILVQLSFFLSSILVGIANDFGAYIDQVFDWVFRNDTDWSVGAALFGEQNNIGDYVLASGFLALGAFAAFGSLFTILAGVALMLILVFVILVARKLLILVALILAPIAAIAWIHPQTDGFAKAWWQVFSKLLLMYPLIILLIKSGELMARATSNTDGDIEFDLVRFIAYFAPFFLIPYTFKFAGGVIGQFAGIADNARKGMVDRARGVDDRRRANRREKAAATFKDNQLKGKRNGPIIRARAGMLGSSIFYGRKGGELYRAEKASEAYKPDDKIRLLNLKAEKQAGEIADYKLQQDIAEWSNVKGWDQPQIMDELANQATDKNLSPIEKSAAMRQLVTLRAVPQLETVFEKASQGSVEDRELITKFKNENFGTLDSFAAHLSRSSYEKNEATGKIELSRGYSEVAKLNPEQLAGQKDTTIRGALKWAAQNNDRAMVDKLATTYLNTATHMRSPDIVNTLVQASHGTVEWADSAIPMTPSVATRVQTELGGSAASTSATTSESISVPTFEQRKQQVINTAQQRDIPIVDDRSITPETISSFETMYGIEQQVQSSDTPQQRAKRVFRPRSPYAGGQVQSGEHSSNASIDIDTPQPPSGGGRHSPEFLSGEPQGRRDSGGPVQPNTSEGRRLRPDDESSGNDNSPDNQGNG